MNKLRLLFLSVLLSSVLLSQAQQSTFQQVAHRYDGVQEVTATVTKTQSVPLQRTTTSQGRLTMRQPSYVCITSDGGRDRTVYTFADFQFVKHND